MFAEINLLLVTAVTLGFLHTILGPDHYVPFIAMARARRWSLLKTAVITTVCGIGHVGSSVLLGMLGVALGLGVERLEIFESARGGWAAWALIMFGLAYFIYGVHYAVKGKKHSHLHVHADGEWHEHDHAHSGGHAHVHDQKQTVSLVPWALFVVFILGPCEVLIPMLMYPAAKHSFSGMMLVAVAFGLATIGTMLGAVILGAYGLRLVPFDRLQQYSHAIAGFVIFSCGCGVQFLGW